MTRPSRGKVWVLSSLHLPKCVAGPQCTCLCPHKIPTLKSWPPKWLYLKTGPVRRAIKATWSHKGWALIQGEEERNQRSLHPCSHREAVWGHNEKVPFASQEETPLQKPALLAPWSDFGPPQLWESGFLLVKPPRLWYFVMATPAG